MIKKIIRKLLREKNISIHRGVCIPMDGRQMKSLIGLSRFYEKISNIEGSIVECGVGKGRTFLYFAFLTYQEGRGRKVYGYDSFEGFPMPSKEDMSARNPQKGEWNDLRPRHVLSILANAGLPKEWVDKKIDLIPGFFNDSLKEYAGGNIAFLHIDADLYQSYLDVLHQLFPKVVKGGVVLFDEYGEAKWPGAKKAVDEFFKDSHYRPIRDEYLGKYYIVK